MILITGSQGQLGIDLQKFLKKNNVKFLAKSKKKLDISKPITALSIKKFSKIKTIINLGAYTNVDKAETSKKQCYAVNVTGTKNLVDLSNKINATLIHISTDYVFSGKSNRSFKELDQTQPINYYGYSKMLAETLIISKCKKFYIIRTSWVFSNNKNNFINFIKNNLKNKKIKLIYDQFGNPTSTLSLSEILYRLVDFSINATNKCYGVYHFCNYPKTNWFKFGSYFIEDVLKLNNIDLIKIKGVDLNLEAKRPEKSFLNSAKISKLLKLKKFDWRIELKKL